MTAVRRVVRSPGGVRRVVPALVVGTLALVAALLVPTTSGTLTTAISNRSDTAASGIWTAGCGAAARTVGNALFVWPLDDASGTTARDVSAAGTATGTYRNTGNVAYAQPGPCAADGGKAVTLTGSAADTSGNVTFNTLQVNPQVFSTAIWFKTSTTTGGKLIGFGSSLTGPSSSYDRHLYMTNAGNVTAGVYSAVGLATGAGATTRTVTSTKTLADGVWHLAVMSVGPTTDANPGLRLYIDGTLQGTPDTTVSAAQVFNGYWRVGYDNLNGWPNQPSSLGFNGSLAFAQVYTSVLTPAQVTSLYNAGR